MVKLEWNGEVVKRGVNKATLKALNRSGLLVQNTAKQLVRKDTRELEKSIVLELDPQDLTMKVKTDTEYAYYQEFGTKKMSAQPYMRPALNNNRQNIRNIFAEEEKKVIGN